MPVGLSDRFFAPVSWDWGSVPDWALVLTAVVTAWFAIKQLRLSRIAREDAVDTQRTANLQHKEYLRIEQGNQLMQIDDKYETVLQDSRKAIFALCRGLEKTVPAGQDRHAFLATCFSNRLDELLDATRSPVTDDESGQRRDTAVREYFCLMQLPQYLETVGVLVRDGLVSETALLELYDAMFYTVLGCVLPHIRARRRDDDNPNLLIWAEALYDKAAVRMAASAAPKPAASGTP